MIARLICLWRGHDWRRAMLPSMRVCARCGARKWLP